MLWPNIVKIIKYWEGLCKSKTPQNKSYENLTKHYLDKLFPLKLQFFKDIAGQLKGFLKAMQIDQPMVPFLDESLSDIVLTLMRIIVKPAVLTETNTNYKLIKIDLSNANNLCPCELIKLPTATKALVVKAELPTQKKRNFLKDCQAMIVAVLQKIQEKCPLKYGIVRYSSSLSPSKIITQKEMCRDNFGKLAEKIYGGNWISSKSADQAKKEFDALLKSAHSELKDVFLTFDQKTDRIDSFYAGIMSESASYKDCWEIFKFVFTLSHGQASIERGFSINKELLVENLQEESIVCQRMVYDHVNCSGKSITEVPMTNALLKSCKLAYSRYAAALQEKKEKSDGELKDRKRKMKKDKIAQVKEKKRAVESCIESLNKDIENYSIAAEKEANLSLLMKANSFRVTVRSKKETLATLESTLTKLNEELRLI